MTTPDAGKSPMTRPRRFPSLPTLEDYAFFSVAVGFGMPWTALSSELGYLKALHGPTFLLYLNLASCLPCLPTLILQLIFDQGHNQRFGTAKATLVRQCSALLLCTLCCASLPFLPWTQKPVLVAVAALVGTAGSVAFGSTSQLVARFPAKCGQALALGIVAAGPTVLLLQAALQLTAHPTPLQQTTFFLLAALAPLNGLLAITALLFRHWDELQGDKSGRHARGSSRSCRASEIAESLLESAEWDSSVDRGSRSLSAFHGQHSAHGPFGGEASFGYSLFGSGAMPTLPAGGLEEPVVALMELLPASFASAPGAMPQGADAVLLLPEATAGEQEDDPEALTMRSDATTTAVGAPPSAYTGSPASVIDYAVQRGLKAAAKAVAPLAISLGSSVGVTVMLFPLFTVVRSSGLLGSMLPQALFAACMLPDILGRVIARAGLPSLATVEVLAAIKFASLAPALAYLWCPDHLLSDVAVVLFVVAHWLLNGLIGAWSYMLLPQALPDPQAAALGGAVMSTAFQAFSISGLAAALLLENLAHPPTEL